jgi:hypothetical protein
MECTENFLLPMKRFLLPANLIAGGRMPANYLCEMCFIEKF